jgi:hypothetical protein
MYSGSQLSSPCRGRQYRLLFCTQAFGLIGSNRDRQTTQHGCLPSLQGDGDKRIEIVYGEKITINVPLFKKLRDIIFFVRDNSFLSHFEGHFEGAKTFFTP